MNGWERLVIGSLGIDTSYRSARIILECWIDSLLHGPAVP